MIIPAFYSEHSAPWILRKVCT